MTQIQQAIIVDDHKLFGDMLGLMLEKANLFRYVYVVDNKTEFLDLLSKIGNKEVCIFLDYYVHDDNGLALFNDVKRINSKARTIFITSAISPSVISHIHLARPNAILSKASNLSELIECIKAVDKHGDVYLDATMRKVLAVEAESDVLTAREIEILKYFEQGLSVIDTAEKAFLSKHTIVSHRRNMMKKTKSHTIGQLIKYAKDTGLI